MLKPPSGLNQITIEPPVPDDSAMIVQIRRVCYSVEADTRKDWQIPQIVERSSRLAQDISESIVLEAKADGVIVGSVRATRLTDQCLIDRLFVHTSFRNLGIGSQLLSAAERRLCNAKTIRAYLGMRVAGTMAFLQKRGYSVSAEYGLTNGVDLLYMEKARPVQLLDA